MLPVPCIENDTLALITPGCNMVEGTRILDAKRPCHRAFPLWLTGSISRTAIFFIIFCLSVKSVGVVPAC